MLAGIYQLIEQEWLRRKAALELRHKTLANRICSQED